MVFAIMYWDFEPALQPIAEAHVLHVYVILWFISSALPKSGPSLYALQARKRKHSVQRPCQNGLFL